MDESDKIGQLISLPHGTVMGTRFFRADLCNISVQEIENFFQYQHSRFFSGISLRRWNSTHPLPNNCSRFITIKNFFHVSENPKYLSVSFVSMCLEHLRNFKQKLSRFNVKYKRFFNNISQICLWKLFCFFQGMPERIRKCFLNNST